MVTLENFEKIWNLEKKGGEEANFASVLRHPPMWFFGHLVKSALSLTLSRAKKNHIFLTFLVMVKKKQLLGILKHKLLYKNVKKSKIMLVLLNKGDLKWLKIKKDIQLLLQRILVKN